MSGTKFAAAFLQAQKKIGRAVKDSTNPHFGNRFASLGAVQDACLAALHESGISVIQSTQLLESGGDVILKTILMHESGESIESTYPLRPQRADPQGFGSALTYARRYCLASMVGVVQDDDDGAQASKPKPQAQRKPESQEPSGPSVAKLKQGLAGNKTLESLERTAVAWDQAWDEHGINGAIEQNQRDEGRRLLKEAIEKARGAA